MAELFPGRSQQEIDSGTQPLDHPAVAGLPLETVETATHESEEPEGTGDQPQRCPETWKYPERAMGCQRLYADELCPAGSMVRQKPRINPPSIDSRLSQPNRRIQICMSVRCGRAPQ